MKKNLLFVTLLIGVLFGCSKTELAESGNLKTEHIVAKTAKQSFSKLNSLGLSPNVQSQYQNLLSEGLSSDTVNGRINMYNDLDSLVAFIINSKLTFVYHGFGGNIEAPDNNTVAIFGRFNDMIHGYGTKVFVQGPNKLYGTGLNLSGLNILNLSDWTWEANKNWVIQTANRGDIIRFISDPSDLRNIYRNGVNGEKTTTGMEVAVLDSLGFEWNPSLHQFIKN
ncbi:MULTISPECIES: hypothetical protein [Sphingobacterium]|uniref:hypothetical protein n=1 Tax=Sphingobacterium TaxID=28453 RepID=UPI001043FE0C|nr:MULTISPECIES: hypothetical protein [Sphingobacterium]MCW2263156.1 hypothetical protein [Sphingobacterium kitahiroshimense]TCR11860.1 hypothetical protein EDF67_103273 [Sphingobacterium sp. JUb78]